MLQISWVHFEEGRAAGVSGLQHVQRFKLGTEGKEMVREPDSGPAARGAGRTAAKTLSKSGVCFRRRQPLWCSPSSQLGWGAKFTLKPRLRAR